MGVYDTMTIFCPVCGRPKELQSKAGGGSMARYTIADVPAAIADDLVGNHTCKCGKCMHVTLQWMVTVH